MSGLSLADMRRIGAERNQTGGQDKAGRKSLLSKLSFGRSDASASAKGSPIARLAQLGQSSDAENGAGAFHGQSVAAAQPVPLSGDLASASPTPVFAEADALTRHDAAKPLRENLFRHIGVGGVIGATAGFVATSVPIAAPVGGIVGAAAGSLAGKRAQRIAADRSKPLPLKEKQAPDLFQAVRSASGLVECSEGPLKIAVDPSAGLRARAIGGSRKASPKGYELTIGFAALAGLSVRQVEALAAHALVMAKREAEAESVDHETLSRLDVLSASLSKRSKIVRLSNLDQLAVAQTDAKRAFQQAVENHAREADILAARYAGPRALVDALLAQALLAARVWQELSAGQSYADAVEALSAGYAAPELDGALHYVADHRLPPTDQTAFGLPIMLLERVAGLDTSCAVPVLPAEEPILATLPASTRKALEKRLLAPERPPLAGSEASEKAGKKRRATSAVSKLGADTSTPLENHGTKNARKQAEPIETAPKASAQRPKGLIGSLFRNRSKKDVLRTLDPHQQPLYHADELYKSDPALGLEAYQALVDANPRWALARLRMAEAQIEMGVPDCVANLMMCADRLPSALPTILDRLQSALAMVSPLEEEPLRQAVSSLQSNATAIAQERAEIDLEKLSNPTLDEQDRETLASLFNHSAGLREVWVLGAPCAHMPEVPHHAILGLAPRKSPEDAHALAMTLAEHAAISGTVAVHIETGTPRGALGDTLATYPSLWRAARG